MRSKLFKNQELQTRYKENIEEFDVENRRRIASSNYLTEDEQKSILSKCSGKIFERREFDKIKQEIINEPIQEDSIESIKRFRQKIVYLLTNTDKSVINKHGYLVLCVDNKYYVKKDNNDEIRIRLFSDIVPKGFNFYNLIRSVIHKFGDHSFNKNDIVKHYAPPDANSNDTVFVITELLKYIAHHGSTIMDRKVIYDSDETKYQFKSANLPFQSLTELFQTNGV